MTMMMMQKFDHIWMLVSYWKMVVKATIRKILGIAFLHFRTALASPNLTKNRINFRLEKSSFPSSFDPNLFCGHPRTPRTVHIHNPRFPQALGRPQNSVSTEKNLPERLEKAAKNQTKMSYGGNFDPTWCFFTDFGGKRNFYCFLIIFLSIFHHNLLQILCFV